jgi:hypothetical protein
MGRRTILVPWSCFFIFIYIKHSGIQQSWRWRSDDSCSRRRRSVAARIEW